jgi:hypothetical protein
MDLRDKLQATLGDAYTLERELACSGMGMDRCGRFGHHVLGAHSRRGRAGEGR